MGRAGRVVGLDSSGIMLAEARNRVAGLNLPVEFCIGEAEHLSFPDNSFDGCRTERVLVHLKKPARAALIEMVRVARPGARIVVYDADWGTLAFDVPGRMIMRKLLNFFCDSSGSRWIGRQLRGIFAVQLIGSPVVKNVCRQS